MRSTRRWNIWPAAIVAYFIVFISALVIWVAFAMRNDMELVRKDYYEDEIRFQDQIDRVRRTAPIRHQVAIDYDFARHFITLKFPVAHLGPNLTGTIHLYRPSDASLDQKIELAPKPDGTQQIDTKSLQPGLWKVRFSWYADGASYYAEQSLLIGPA